MAITYTFAPIARNEHERYSTRRAKPGVLTLTGTYVTGGEAPAASVFGLSVLEALIFQDGSTSAGHVCRRDAADNKILLYETGDTVSTPLDLIGNGETATGTINVIALGY